MNNRLNFGPNSINGPLENTNNIARNNNILSFFQNNNSQINLSELYSKAVGEMGITPSDAIQMTAEEIDAAYEGYLRRKELEANLMMLAFLRALGGSDEPIVLTEEKGYELGSQEERERVFSSLGISIDEV